MRRKSILVVAVLLAALWTTMCIHGVSRQLPQGISYSGDEHRGVPVEFLYDLTFEGDTGRVVQQAIFDRVFRMIDRARRLIVIDMFLFNGEHGGDREYLPLAEKLSERLIEKKRASPGVEIIFITDEINNFYGAYTSREIRELRANDVHVVVTDLTRLRDSNPGYSALWRSFVQWFGTSGRGVLPHPLTSAGRKVTLRSYLKLLNFKANHRKVIVTERECLAASANPHDASSFHSNVAFAMRGAPCADMLQAESAVLELSGGPMPSSGVEPVPEGDAAVSAQYLTEGQIQRRILEEIASLSSGDRLDIAMFYLSDRTVIRELLRAADRGVTTRVILDPNKDAFGREKGGIPNRQVARELVTRSEGTIALRWYDTHGEQFHTKLVLAWHPDHVTAVGGSANLTRRNLDDFNLEADVRIRAPRGSALAVEFERYFERLWTNTAGDYTVDYSQYEDRSWLKRLVYRLQEWSGFSSY
ncbi:MAG: phospholipase [Gemmatimonadales bacterium]|nr:phospholipase [Gemmatimonadales bacterium]